MVPRCGGVQVRDCGNASPRNMRLSLNYVPNQSSLLHTCGMPLAVVLQPLALPGPDDDPIPVRTVPHPPLLFRGCPLRLLKRLSNIAFQLHWWCLQIICWVRLRMMKLTGTNNHQLPSSAAEHDSSPALHIMTLFSRLQCILG